MAGPGGRTWLTATMHNEMSLRRVTDAKSDGWAFLSPPVLLLAFGYFGIIMGLYGFGLWLPQIVKKFGFTNSEVGFVAALPYIAAAVFMVYWGRRLDRRGDRGWHAAIACLIGGLGLASSALLSSPVVALISLSFAAMGVHAAMPTFWTIPTSFLSGTAAATSIGFISSMGHLGGFTGPYLMGVLKEATGEFSLGLAGLSVPLLISGVIAWSFRDRKSAISTVPVPA